MNLKLKPIQIDPNDPFKSDLLGRRDEILNLSLLAKKVNSPAVIAIDSRWETGKTTFIKLWGQHIKAENSSTLYFFEQPTDTST